MNNIAVFLKNHKNFLICMHVDPDGDTIGSSYALGQALKKLKKKVLIFSKDPIPQKYSFLKSCGRIVSSLRRKASFDAVVAIDCSDKKRISSVLEIEKHSDTIINIDHHSDNTRFGNINYVREASSTGELVYELINKMKIKIDKHIAEAIYAAIITDTGNFKYDNTSQEIFRIAANLVKIGVSPYETALKIYETRTKNEIKILGKALQRIEYYYGNKVGVVALPNKLIKETGAQSSELTPIVDFIRSIKDVEIAVLIRETADRVVKANLRSKRKNVQLIAKHLGGGGHPKAAGVLFSEPINSAKEKILKAIKLLWTVS